MKNVEIFIKILEDAYASTGNKDAVLTDLLIIAKIAKEVSANAFISGLGRNIEGQEAAIAAGFYYIEALNKGKSVSEISDADLHLKLSELLTLDAELEENPEAKDIILSRYQKFSVEIKDADERTEETPLSDKYKGLKENFKSFNNAAAEAAAEAAAKMKKMAENAGEHIGATPAYKPQHKTETFQSYGSSSSSDNGWSAGKVVGCLAAAAGIGLVTYAAYSWWNSDVVYGGDDLESIDLGI